jgi:ribosomal protein S4
MKKYKEQKYKNLLSIRELPYQNNLRILKFKRPKWNFFKKAVQRQANKIFFFRRYKKLNKKLYFYNQKGYLISSRWTNIRFRYKELLLAKRRLFLFFSLKTKLGTLKKKVIKRTSLNFLTKLETRLDILLWRIGVFTSPAIARFYLNHKKIKLNNKTVNISSILIKKGDIISISDEIKNSILTNVSKFKNIKTYNKKFLIFKDTFNSFVPYFMEMNWDLLEFVCLQNTDELNIKGMLHMYPKNLNIAHFKHYLRLL